MSGFINKTPWLKAEDDELLRLQGKHGNRWAKVASEIADRGGQQCAQRWRHKVNPDICKEPWGADEDVLLQSLVKAHGMRWAVIARDVKGRTDQQCMGRWRRHLDPEVKRSEWTTKEDRGLTELHHKHGANWSAIAKALKNRTAQQCRARWFQAHFTGRRYLDEEGNLLAPSAADAVEWKVEVDKALAVVAGTTLRPNGVAAAAAAAAAGNTPVIVRPNGLIATVVATAKCGLDSPPDPAAAAGKALVGPAAAVVAAVAVTAKSKLFLTPAAPTLGTKLVVPGTASTTIAETNYGAMRRSNGVAAAAAATKKDRLSQFPDLPTPLASTERALAHVRGVATAIPPISKRNKENTLHIVKDVDIAETSSETFGVALAHPIPAAVTSSRTDHNTADYVLGVGTVANNHRDGTVSKANAASASIPALASLMVIGCGSSGGEDDTVCSTPRYKAARTRAPRRKRTAASAVLAVRANGGADPNSDVGAGGDSPTKLARLQVCVPRDTGDLLDSMTAAAAANMNIAAAAVLPGADLNSPTRSQHAQVVGVAQGALAFVPMSIPPLTTTPSHSTSLRSLPLPVLTLGLVLERGSSFTLSRGSSLSGIVLSLASPDPGEHLATFTSGDWGALLSGEIGSVAAVLAAYDGGDV